MCRAIITSSFVGITHAATRLETLLIRGPWPGRRHFGGMDRARGAGEQNEKAQRGAQDAGELHVELRVIGTEGPSRCA